jgi:hypothetical protein
VVRVAAGVAGARTRRSRLAIARWANSLLDVTGGMLTLAATVDGRKAVGVGGGGAVRLRWLPGVLRLVGVKRSEPAG